ncbi:MAG: hypothetical protein ACI9LO_001478 [Planctomycetota bacterium]|jgi:hypothetical protein
MIIGSTSKAHLAELPLGGGTNQVGASDEIQAQLAPDLTAQLSADDVQNISYFIADGEANTGNSGNSPIGSDYIEFVNDNSIDSCSVGIASSLPDDLSDLNYSHNIDSFGQGVGYIDDAITETDVSELESELLSTVPTAFGGNITATGSVSSVLFGTDGGFVQSFTARLGDPGTDYTFTHDGTNVTVPATLTLVVVSASSVELNADDGFAFGSNLPPFSTQG